VRRQFWKAAGISAGLYAGAVLLGLLIDFRLAFFSLLAIQVTWTLFCAGRAVQLRFRGVRSELYEKEDFEFAMGGLLSSISLFIAFVVFTQVV
jgi:hypothetical protein